MLSPLDAARRLAAVDPRESDICVACRSWWCDDDIFNPENHRADCPWLAMPRIVAALEAAAQLRAPCNEAENCWYCNEYVMDGSGQHAPDCPWQALVAALKGEAEVTA